MSQPITTRSIDQRHRARWLAWSAVLPALLAVTGCVKTLTPQELEAEREAAFGQSYDSWWYCGSRSGFDYFFRKRPLSSGDYQMLEADSPVTNRFPYTNDRSRWVLQPWSVPYKTDPIKVPIERSPTPATPKDP